MPRPILYKHGRRKVTLEGDLADMLEQVSIHTKIPMSQLLDEAVSDWKRRRSVGYLQRDAA